jgi:Zn-dependent protease with chaperone function
MLDNLSYDSIALVLGHELAHIHLRHNELKDFYGNKLGSQYNEAMADKLGAFYALRAGFDVCKGREVWKYFLNKYGNRINSTHPNHSYRYEELDIGCSK